MNKWITLLVCLMLLSACSKPEHKVEPATKEEVEALVEFNALPRLSEKELDQFLYDKKDGIVYAGWLLECGDSRNFQVHYLEDLLINHPEWKEKIVLFDLDQDHAEALKDKKLRKVLIDKYGVGYSPTLLRVEKGAIVEKLEWTLKSADPLTAIPKEDLDHFFGIK